MKTRRGEMMMTSMKWWRLTLICVLLAGVASAIEPAYEGPLGNAEEPALRPFKWMLRGIKALAYHPVMAVKEGNQKTPGLGCVEVFRGIRKGVVEFDESFMKGAMGQVPPPAGDYKKLGKVNGVINEDPLLRNVADGAAGVLVCGGYPSVDSGDLVAGAGLLSAQKAVDWYPLHDLEEREAAEEKAKAMREARRPAPRKRGKTRLERIKPAQRRYVSGRIGETKRKPHGTGNLLEWGK